MYPLEELKRERERESKPGKQSEKEWEYCYLWRGLQMDLLRAHLLRLEESYGGDYDKCVNRPFDQKVRTFSFKRAGWPIGFQLNNNN